jgi:mono/diheme cytochrome c family protein
MPVSSATRSALRRILASAPRLLAAAALAALAVEFWGACNRKESGNVDPQVARGRVVYASNCIACHNPDPSRDGTLGPAIKGSRPELVKARVMRAEYPPGYTPKRTTRIMVALPLKESDVEAVAAYLNAP